MNKKITAVLAAALLAAAALHVKAAQTVRSSDRIIDLLVTNKIDGTASVLLSPTNTVSGFNTGRNVDVSDCTDVGIEVRATVVSTNTTDLLAFTFVRASVGNNSPTGGDFEADDGPSAWTFSVPIVTTGAPGSAVTNTAVLHTNPPSLWLRGATHIGLSRITNRALPLTLATETGATATNSQTTNLKVSVVKGDRRGF